MPQVLLEDLLTSLTSGDWAGFRVTDGNNSNGDRSSYSASHESAAATREVQYHHGILVSSSGATVDEAAFMTTIGSKRADQPSPRLDDEGGDDLDAMLASAGL